MGRKINLIGQTFERLTVESESPERKNGGSVRWVCNCICGCQIIVSSNSLKTGNTKSCGCLNLNRDFQRKNNTYDLSGEFGIGYTENGKFFYFDLDDYETIKKYYWYSGGHGYFYTKVNDLTNKEIAMHRFILNISDKNIFVDHENRITYDNRKSNIRPADKKENTHNRKLYKNNHSGFVGVRWIKNRQKWRASIGNKTIGEYIIMEDAIKARLIYEKEYYKEFSPNKHLFEEYGI